MSAISVAMVGGRETGEEPLVLVVVVSDIEEGGSVGHVLLSPTDAHMFSEQVRQAAEAASIEAEKSAQTTLEEN